MSFGNKFSPTKYALSMKTGTNELSHKKLESYAKEYKRSHCDSVWTSPVNSSSTNSCSNADTLATVAKVVGGVAVAATLAAAVSPLFSGSKSSGGASPDNAVSIADTGKSAADGLKSAIAAYGSDGNIDNLKAQVAEATAKQGALKEAIAKGTTAEDAAVKTATDELQKSNEEQKADQNAYDAKDKEVKEDDKAASEADKAVAQDEKAVTVAQNTLAAANSAVSAAQVAYDSAPEAGKAAAQVKLEKAKADQVKAESDLKAKETKRDEDKAKQQKAHETADKAKEERTKLKEKLDQDKEGIAKKEAELKEAQAKQKEAKANLKKNQAALADLTKQVEAAQAKIEAREGKAADQKQGDAAATETPAKPASTTPTAPTKETASLDDYKKYVSDTEAAYQSAKAYEESLTNSSGMPDELKKAELAKAQENTKQTLAAANNARATQSDFANELGALRGEAKLKGIELNENDTIQSINAKIKAYEATKTPTGDRQAEVAKAGAEQRAEALQKVAQAKIDLANANKQIEVLNKQIESNQNNDYLVGKLQVSLESAKTKAAAAQKIIDNGGY